MNKPLKMPFVKKPLLTSFVKNSVPVPLAVVIFVCVSATSCKPDPVPDPDPNLTESVVYYDNLDKVKSTVNHNYFDTWTACRNMVGSGIDGVSYDGFYASVRSNLQSSGYPGASGVNAVYYGKEDSWIEVKGIKLPAGVSTFTLSVGMNAYDGAVEPDRNFSIILSGGSGNVEHSLAYDIISYGQWSLASATFKVENADRLNVKIVALEGGVNGRTDDLKLVVAEKEASVSYDFSYTDPTPPTPPTPEVKDYVERPVTLKANPDYKYIDHRGTTYKSKQEVRNYEACYDTRRHNPVWVAYPCHAIYWEGGYTRPTKDPWRPEPEMTESQQSVIYASDWDKWPWSENGGVAEDLYHYWSTLPSGKTVIQGHLMRSAERGCGDRYNPIDLNVQTFYPTNIAPECYQNAVDAGSSSAGNSSHWEKVEYILSDKWRCNDTLYVVAGCVYDDESRILYDACNWGKRSEKSKPCVVPTARYKLVLRTKSGSTGKPVWKCSADELMAIGFWFPQNFTGEKLSELPPLSDYIYSVSDIEKKIGGEFNFYPLAPEGVKDSFNINDWPGLSDIAGN